MLSNTIIKPINTSKEMNPLRIGESVVEF